MRFSLAGLDINKSVLPASADNFRPNFSLNTGNLLFHFGAQLVADLDGKVHSWSLADAKKQFGCAGVILPMANHIGRHIDLLQSGPRIQEVDVPLVVLGLGVQFSRFDVRAAVESIPPGTIAWLKSAGRGDKKPNISVRGEFTFDVFKELGISETATVIGCQSNFISPRTNIGERVYKKFEKMSLQEIQDGLGVAAGNYQKGSYSKLERSLIALITGNAGAYLVQNPRDLISLAAGWLESVSRGSFREINSAWFSELTIDEMIRWFRYHSAVYISAPQWILDMQKRSMVVGTRVHGIQAAIQAGTPGLCLCLDSRTLELCETMCLPHVHASEFLEGITLSDCVDKFSQWDFRAYDRRRKLLAGQLVRLLTENDVTPSKHLESLIL